jgi:hypothetical protein
MRLIIQKDLSKIAIPCDDVDHVNNILLKKFNFEYRKKVPFLLVNKSIEFGMPKNLERNKDYHDTEERRDVQ